MAEVDAQPDTGSRLKSQSEKDKRSYATIDSVKLGADGVDYVSGLFGIDPKTVRRGLYPDRDAQFQNIAKLKAAYQNAADPVISMDTKKKGLIGTMPAQATPIRCPQWIR